MRFERRWLVAGLAVAAAATCPAGGKAQIGPSASTVAHGRLSRVEGVRVLHLDGEPFERGFAHGKLLEAEILALMRSCFAEPSMIPSPEFYEQLLLGQLLPRMAFSADELRELEGLYAGILAAAGEAPMLETLGRRLQLRDLQALNCYADFQPLFCSSFSVWGPLTEGGEMVTARNLDYPATDLMRDGQLVVAFAGDGQRKGWVSVTWPGLIGCYTGMNAEGVTASVHDTGAKLPTGVAGFVPRSLALRRAIETAGATTPVEDVARVLAQCPATCGSNVHVSGPAKLTARPAGVVEYDGDTNNGGGATIRWPSAGNGLPATAIVCTNHYRQRAEPAACGRYERLVASLSSISGGGERIDLSACRRLLGSVAQSGGVLSLHSAYFFPDRRLMYVSFASERGSPPAATPVRLDIANLLAAARPTPSHRPTAAAE